MFSHSAFVARSSIATTAAYLSFLHNPGARDSIGLSLTVVWIEVTICISLITASIPSLKSFLWAFMSRGMFTIHGTDTNRTASGSRGGDIVMQSFGRPQHNHNERQTNLHISSQHTETEARMRPDWLEYRVGVTSGSKGARIRAQHTRDNETRSVGSDGSEQMIIHRDVEFEVHQT